jgi:HAD superfamily hydrolase (TIGR01509 family)
MLALCDQLSTQARAAVFTNNGDWLVEHIERIAPDLPRAVGEAIVSSGQLRQSKPDPAAFHSCLARLGGAEPASTLFIDDNADNVAGARRAGLDALLFTDIAALRAALRARGFDLQGEDTHAS